MFINIYRVTSIGHVVSNSLRDNNKNDLPHKYPNKEKWRCVKRINYDIEYHLKLLVDEVKAHDKTVLKIGDPQSLGIFLSC